MADIEGPLLGGKRPSYQVGDREALLNRRPTAKFLDVASQAVKTEIVSSAL